MAQKDKKAPASGKESAGSEIARRFKANPALFIGTVVVLVLVIVSFVLVPAIVPEGGGGADLVFGYYDKVPISWVPGNFFSQYYDQLVSYYRNYVDISDFSIQISLWRQAFEGAAVRTAILQEMKKSNYKVPTKTVDREVAMQPQFQENGRFSAVLYRQMSETSLGILWRQTQDDIAVSQFMDNQFTLLVPSNEANFFGEMFSNMRNFDIVAFSVDDYPDSEYRSFAIDNADLFRTIHLSRISVSSSEREARRILETVRDGTSTFEDAARAQSQDYYADRGGDMGIRYGYEIQQEITDAAALAGIYRLGRGELSDVISVGSMWAFYRVEDELKPGDFEDDTVMEKVRSYVRNFQRGRMEDWTIAQAREFIADAEYSGFDSAAWMRGREKSSFGPLPINYGNVDLYTSLTSFSIPILADTEISDLSVNDNFWRIAFSTRINTLSEPFVQGSKVIVLQPTEQIAVDEEMAADIAGLYSDYWLYYIMERSIPAYFLNSPKMNDHFWETYYGLLY
jgi:hypothetical protein